MRNINDLRKKINDIDENLVDLISERLKVVSEIGVLKQLKNLEIKDIKREKELLERLSMLAKEKGINPNIVLRIWRILIKVSYTVEEENAKSKSSK